MSEPPAEDVRIDRWLVAARLLKTRPLAQEACAGGKVTINGTTASPHKAVRAGDRIRLTTARGHRELVVRDLGVRRLSASLASALYEDVTPPPTPRPELPPGADERAFAPRLGRPSKRDRRQINRLRGR